MRLPWRKPRPTYRCYWVAAHFATAEDAARFFNEHPELQRMQSLRLLRGGETVPVCFEP